MIKRNTKKREHNKINEIVRGGIWFDSTGSRIVIAKLWKLSRLECDLVPNTSFVSALHHSSSTLEFSNNGRIGRRSVRSRGRCFFFGVHGRLEVWAKAGVEVNYFGDMWMQIMWMHRKSSVCVVCGILEWEYKLFSSVIVVQCFAKCMEKQAVSGWGHAFAAVTVMPVTPASIDSVNILRISFLVW